MERMDYEAFKKQIAEDILRFLPEEYQDAALFRGIDFTNAKERIVCRLVNYENNKERISDKPYRRLGDLAAVYQISFEREGEEIRSALVTHELLGYLQIPESELHSIALTNMERISPCRLERRQDVLLWFLSQNLMDQLDIDAEAARELAAQAAPPAIGLHVYCLTNADNTYGAAEILLPHVQEMIAERAGGDYYILPSSIHEVLIVPKTEAFDYRKLEELVNAAEVKPEDQLSGHVYEYDAEKKLLRRSDSGEALDAEETVRREEQALVMKKGRGCR